MLADPRDITVTTKTGAPGTLIEVTATHRPTGTSVTLEGKMRGWLQRMAVKMVQDELEEVLCRDCRKQKRGVCTCHLKGIVDC